MAEGVRLELTSAILETAVLTFERTLNVHGGRNRTRTGTAFRPKVFKTFACYLFRHSPIKGVLGTGRHP